MPLTDVKTARKLYDACQVFLLDPTIRAFLDANNPKSVEQALAAVAEADAPEPEAALPSADDYRRALDAQHACNLSGIVRSFARVTEKLWAQAKALGKGTEFVNRHPISRLYAEQIAYLSSGAGVDDHESYSAAYDVCTDAAEGGELPFQS